MALEKQEQWGIHLPAWKMLPDIGLYMDQVITLTERIFKRRLPKGETTKSMVNNYVKSGLLPRPVGKKYDREHIARLLMLLILKQALSMESIAKLMDALCEGGTEAGYERFCGMLSEIEAAAQAGHIDMRWEGEAPMDRALSAGLMAAVCTVYTHGVLRGTADPKEEGK